MRGGNFNIAFDENKLSPVLYWVLQDRKTGKVTFKSEPLTSLETITGEIYSLEPSDSKPWFKPEDGGGSCLYGKMINSPNRSPSEIFKTDEIMRAIERDGTVHETTLALTDKAYEGHVPTLGPKDLGLFIADILRDSMEETPQNGENEEPKTGRPKFKGRASPQGEPPPP